MPPTQPGRLGSAWLQPAVWLCLLFWAAQGVEGQTAGNTTSVSAGSDNKLLCMAEMVSSIENSCSASDTQGYYVALEALLKQYLSKCFQTNFTENQALHEMMPDINDGMTQWLENEAEEYKQTYNLEDVVLTFVPPQQVDAEVEFMLQHNLAISYDGWLLDPYVYGSISKYGGFYPLDSAVAQPALGLDWQDVHPFVRSMLASYKGQVVSFPLDVSIHLLFYRRDLDQNAQLPQNSTGVALSAVATNATVSPSPAAIAAAAVPAESLDPTGWTWQQLLDAAAKANNTDLNGDGVPDYGICMETRADCDTQVADLMAIAASMLQYTGTSQGIFFDPALLKSGGASALLVDNPALQAALSIYAQLSAYAPPASATAKCDTPSRVAELFRDGRCAFILGSRIFKALNLTTSGPFVRGKVGVAQLPGSSQVLDRSTNTLTACTPSLCPYSIQGKDGSFVNQVAWNPGGGWVLAVNQRSPSNSQGPTTQFHATLANSKNSWEFVSKPQFVFEPHRWSHLQNLSSWLTVGYEQGDVQSWLSALTLAMDMNTSSPLRAGAPGLGRNMAMDLRVPGTSQLRDLYAYAVTNVSLGANVTEATSMLATSIMRLLQDTQKIQASWAEVADAYFATILYQEPQTPSGQSGSGGSSTPSWLPVAIILPVVAVLLLVALGVVYEVRNKRHHKDLWGKVVPPGAGPDTTVLVMAVQDMLDVSVMLTNEQLAGCMGMMMEVIQRALQHHSGYLAAHDSSAGTYVTAFHSPKDALLAGLEVQQELLSLNWPTALTSLASTATVHVVALTNDSQPADLSEILDVNDAAPQHLQRSTTMARTRLKRFMQRKMSAHGVSAGDDHGDNDTGMGESDFHIAGMGMAPSGPAIPALMNVPTSETYTFAAACKRAWKDASSDGAASSRMLIFRGLRMRMGIHMGLTNPDWVVPVKDDPSKVQYVGPVVQLAAAIAELAQGGMLLLSEETYKKLPLERLWDRHLVLHVGEHPSLEAATGPTNLYLAINRSVEGRLAHLGPLMEQLAPEPGVLQAPVGYVTISFMNVVGAQTLLSWNADVAQAALKLFHTLVGDELRAQGGYLVEAVDGLFLAAFTQPSNAILWALECNDLMLKQNWPEELLNHELCEELVISSPSGDDEMLHSVVFRGLRLKAGVDTGQVLGEVHAMTGRMTYRGKVMNRAARVAGTASTGQVLCSSDAWELAMSRDAARLQAARVSASSMGLCRLKGVAERMEIQHCRRGVDPEVRRTHGARRTSLVLSIGQRWNWGGAADPDEAGDLVGAPSDVELEVLMPDPDIPTEPDELPK